MARRLNTRPTLIYWLFDTRPETVAVFGPEGQPFYCGKTVEGLPRRFRSHFKDAKRWSSRKTATMVMACGKEHLRIQLMETVPVDGDWVERECWWIAECRRVNPNCTNIAKGGQGPVGYIPSDAQRDLARRLMTGNKNAKGTVYTAEQRAAMSERYRGRRATAETKAKMRASHRGSPSAEERERIAASLRGKPHSEARKQAMRDGWTRRKARLAQERALTFTANALC